MALSNRKADGQSVRIPADGSRDVQASIQDIKDVLRAAEAKNQELQAEVKRLWTELEQAGKRLKSLESIDNFEEIENEVVFNSPLGIPDGSETVPALFFTDDSDTGVFRIGDDTFGITAGGIKQVAWQEADGSNFNLMAQYDNKGVGYAQHQMVNTGAAGYYYFSYNNASFAGGMYFRNNTAAFIHFGTDAVDYWSLESGGSFIPLADNARDIGNDSYRVKRIYVEDTFDFENGQIDGLVETHGCLLHNVNGIQNTNHYPFFWKAPYDGVILKLYVIKLGGTSATVNVFNGTQNGNILSSAYVISTDNQWLDAGTLQNTTIDADATGDSAGNRFYMYVSATSGTVTDIACEIVIKRTGV